MKNRILFNIIFIILSACSASNVSNKQKDSKENLAKQKFGIEIADLTNVNKDDTGLSHGVAILRVYAHFPASKAGILKGDIIVKLDDKNILSVDEFDNILKGYKYKYGQVTLGIIRNNQSQKFTLYLE